MTTFIKKIIIFILPIGLIFIVPLFILLTSREYYSTEKAIEAQTNNPEIVYGPAYNNIDRLYKKQLVAAKQPEVVALGSSRVMQFRKEFFIKPESFVNGGGGASSLLEIEKFIKDLPTDNKIKLIIINLDHEMFKSDKQFTTIYNTEPNIIIKWLKNDWRQSYLDYFSGKFSLTELLQQSKKSEHIGLNALIHNSGFRQDGSYQYGKTLLDHDRDKNLTAEFAATLESIKNDRSSFIFSKEIPDSTMKTVDDILRLCQERGIYVIGYLPPMPRQFYNKISNIDDDYKANMLSLPKKVGLIFSERNFDFYNFSDIKTINATDEEFVDAQHGTDKIYIRIAIYMSLKNKQLHKYINSDNLIKLLQDTKKDFIEIPQ